MRPITVIGGGVAGLALGIGLRKAGVPVEIFESGDYPRHKVCGEFISGAGQDVIASLGLGDAMTQADATLATTGALFLGPVHSPVRAFPRPGLCISRYQLDKTMADTFKAAGGRLQTNSRRSESQLCEGVVWAAGRRAHPVEKGWRWFGLKAHATSVDLCADLELHAVDDGYVGICRLAGGVVNVCGLFRRRSGGPSAEWHEALRGAPGSSLRGRMAGAAFDENSFCAVAGLSWNPSPPQQFCRIGDALAMTPPATGNGMSIAFETAALAIVPLLRFSRGELVWSAAQEAITAKCSIALTRRLRWARWLHWAMMSQILQRPLGSLILNSDFLWRLFFDNTRGTPPYLTQACPEP